MTANDLDKRKNLPVGILIVNLHYMNIFYSRVHSVIRKYTILLNKFRILITSEAGKTTFASFLYCPSYYVIK